MVSYARLNPQVAAASICLIFFSLSSAFVLGNYQNHNGDFGQYFLHARNILEGRSWDYALIGKPAVLPGYPMILTVIVGIAGLNGYAIGLVNALFWAAACFLAYRLYEEKFISALTGYAYLILILFSPYLIYFQQDGQPNIFYSLTFMAALWASRRWSTTSPKIYEILLVMLPAVVRLESVALYAAVFLFLVCQRRLWQSAIPLAGLLLSLSLDLSLNYLYSVNSNIALGTQIGQRLVGESPPFLSLLVTFLATALGYLLTIAEVLLPTFVVRPLSFVLAADLGPTVKFGLAHVALVVWLGISLLVVRPLLSPDKIALAAHVSVISMFMLSALPHRYLLPIVPIAGFYLVAGMERIPLILPGKQFLGTVLLAIAVGFGAYNFLTKMNVPRAANSLLTADAREMAIWVAAEQDERVVGYWKDRLMQVLLDVYGGDPSKVVGVRTDRQIEAVFKDDGLVVFMINPSISPDLVASAQRSGTEVWRNRSFAVYGRSVGR